MRNLERVFFAGVGSPRDRVRSLPCRVAAPGDPPHPLIQRVLRDAGIDARAYRAASLNRRLPACLRQLRVDDAAAGLDRLDRQPSLAAEVLDALLIGVSEFFRDPGVFDILRDTVLPELRRRSSLQVLSAGCSDGQELYSVALLLEDAGLLGRASLLGVDCRVRALERARRGRFDAPFRDRAYALRGRLEWRWADLPFFEDARRFDLILFRNVAIYLDDASPLWERLRAHLAPGGWLVTGKAERPPAALSLNRVAPCIYRSWP